MMRAQFITFEGIDGAGKSSHLEHVHGRIAAHGHAVTVTREPGGTQFGEKLREVVLHHHAGAFAEALAMFAARREHLEAVIEPALASGMWVVCDRFTDATYAYQCGGGGLDKQVVLALERIVHPGRQPDATFLFDLEPAIAYARARERNGTPDRFERQAADFFARVRAAYLERAQADPARIRVIDASGDIDAVRARVDAALSPLLA